MNNEDKAKFNLEEQPAAIASVIWQQQARIAALENERRTNFVDKKKFYGAIVSAVVGTAVVTVFGLLRIANSDHFTILALSQRVETVEEILVPRAEFQQRAVFIDNTLNRIDSKLDRLLEK